MPATIQQPNSSIAGGDATLNVATDFDSSLKQPANMEAPSEIYVSIEAFGSGVPLHPGLTIHFDKTVGDLRRLVISSITCPPRLRTVRLFVGHGGSELDNDPMLLGNSPLASSSAPPMVVCFPVQCTWRSCVFAAATVWDLRFETLCVCVGVSW